MFSNESSSLALILQCRMIIRLRCKEAYTISEVLSKLLWVLPETTRRQATELFV
jgi:hypothetical protein